jgi:branched-chain amino acid transport system permease protein
MIFMVLVGGIGTFEGPVVGAIVLFLIQNHWGSSGVWYLVGLGMGAILFALLLPRGLWGTVRERYAIQLLPVGHFLRGERAAEEPA